MEVAVVPASGWASPWAVAVSRLLQQALFEVDPTDPLICVVVSNMLLLPAECGSSFPARRATRIDAAIAHCLAEHGS